MKHSRKCSISFLQVLFVRLSLVRSWILGDFWISRALSRYAVVGLYRQKLNDKMPGVMTRSKINGGDSISLLELIDVSIVILLSYEIRAWYQMFNKK